MNGTGPLDFEATINTGQFNQMIDEMSRRLESVGTTAEKEGSRIDHAFGNAAAALGAYLSINFASKITGEIRQVRGEFQQLEISFETMLKNKELSNKLMAEVVDFAAKTPFDLKGVAAAAKQLLAYGTSVNEIIPTMRRLGDIASGLSIPFQDLVYLYGTSATQGRLMTKDLMQFAERGIPIIEELGKILNVSKSRVLELASEGSIGFEHLQTVIQNLTDEAGMFGGMMEKQSKTLNGLVSNLGDAWDQMLNDIGKANEGTYADVIKTATRLVENYERVLDILKIIVATYGAYKAGVVLSTISLNGLSRALDLATIKQNLLNLAQKASPWGLALAGITALVGGLYAYNRAMDNSSKRLKEFNETVSNSVSESNILFDRLKKTTSGTEERAAIIKKLEAVHGQYIANLNLEKAALQDIEIAQKAANDEIVRNLAIKAADEEKLEWYKKELEIIKSINALGYEFNKIIEERNNPKFSDYGTRIFVSYGEQVDALLANYEVIQSEKQRIDEAYKKIIEGFKSQFGTTSPDDSIKDLEKRTLSQKLKEIQQLYENYYRWAERYGKESADKQFKELIRGGKSFLEYLETEIKRIESKGVKTKQDRDDLSTYLVGRDDLIGSKSRVEILKDELNSMKEQASDAIEYLEQLREKAHDIGYDDKSESGLTMRKAIAQEILATEKEIAKESWNTYNEILKASTDYTEKRKLLAEEYAALERKLSKEALGPEAYEKAIGLLKEQYDAKLQLLQLDEVKGTDAYKALAEDLGRLTRIEAKAYLQILKEQLKTLNGQPRVYQLIADLITKSEKQLRNWKFEDIGTGLRETAREFNEILSTTGAINTRFGETASQISDIIGQLGNVLGGFASGSFSNPFTAALAVGGLLVKTVDFLDKQFGFQKQIREAEEARIKYNQELQLIFDDLERSLERQLNLLSRMPESTRLTQSLTILKENLGKTIAEIRSIEIRLTTKVPVEGSIYGIKFTLAKGTFDFLKEITNASTEAEALSEALKAGFITKEEYDRMRGYLDALENAQKRLDDIRAQHRDYLLGTVDGLSSAIEQMFINGEISAQSFADTFEKMMRQAVIRSVAMKGMDKQLEAWMNRLYAGVLDGGTSQTWLAEMQSWLQQIATANQQQYEAAMQMLDSVFGKLPDGTNSLSGAIKGVSEETAGLIAGQMNAIRMNQAQVLHLMDQQLLHMHEIAGNTRFNKYLLDIKNLLQSNSSNTANQYRANGGT